MGRGAGIADAFAIETKTIQKLRQRILPFVLLLFVVALIDPNNIGLAALTMNRELAIRSQQFWGAEMLRVGRHSAIGSNPRRSGSQQTCNACRVHDSE